MSMEKFFSIVADFVTSCSELEPVDWKGILWWGISEYDWTILEQSYA